MSEQDFVIVFVNVVSTASVIGVFVGTLLAFFSGKN